MTFSGHHFICCHRYEEHMNEASLYVHCNWNALYDNPIVFLSCIEESTASTTTTSNTKISVLIVYVNL